jgi:hypothetical protein
VYLPFHPAINYRLAPQYPFPCGLHDALAACKYSVIVRLLFVSDLFQDLFLIRPPPGSDHEPVNPAHIIISGDSAGGGLSLALLQVIRDSWSTFTSRGRANISLVRFDALLP